MKRWPVVIVCAGIGCGGGGGAGHLPDARHDDSMIIEEPPLQVTVYVTLAGAPVQNAAVYFQSTAASPGSDTRTGVDGSARNIVDSGGFVTVVEPEPPALPVGAVTTTRFTTFAGVRPGDELHLDLPSGGQGAMEVTFDLTVPNEQLGYTYTLYSSCGQQPIGIGQSPVRGRAAAATLTASVTLAGCHGMADLLVVGTDTDGQVVSWLYQANTAVAGGVPVALAGPYEAPTAMTFTYTHVPVAVSALDVRRELRSARGPLFTTASATATVDKATASATTTINVPTPPLVQGITATVDQPSMGHGQQRFVEWGASASGPYTLDYSAVALRGYQTVASYDGTGRAITWTDVGGIDPSFVLGEYQAQRGDHQWIWRIAAPFVSGTARLSYPTLPAMTFDPNATDADQPTVNRLSTWRVPGGYEAARPHVFADMPVELLGATGRIVFEDVFTPK